MYSCVIHGGIFGGIITDIIVGNAARKFFKKTPKRFS